MDANVSPASVGKALDRVVNEKLKGLSDKVMSYQFDIEPYLLSDKEVMKKLIAKANPQFSAGQLNLMVYGTESVPKLGLSRVGGNIVGTITDVIAGGASASSIPGLGSAQQSVISFTERDSAVSALGSAGFLVGAGGASVGESASQLAEYSSQGKRILQARGTGINEGVAMKSAEFILRFMNSAKRKVLRSYGFPRRRPDGTSEFLLVYVLDTGTDTGTGQGTAPAGPTTVPAGPTTDEEIKIEQEKFADEFEQVALAEAEAKLGGYSPYPLPKDSPLRKFAKEKKAEIREAFASFMSRQKEMVNDFVAALSMVASAIPAMGIIITTPPFNIPAALTLINLVFQAVGKLVGSIVQLIAILERLKDLSTFLGDKAYKQVTKIISPIIDVLTRLIDPIGSLKKFIEKIIEQIKKLFNSDNCKKHRRRLNRDIRRKQRDLKNEKDATEKEDIQDEIKLLQDRLKELDKNCKKTSIEQDTESLNELLQQTSDLSSQIVDEVTEIVYDVELPTGERLTGISQEALEELRRQYTVIVTGEY